MASLFVEDSVSEPLYPDGLPGMRGNLKSTGVVLVQPRKPVYTPHGFDLEPDGGWVKVICSVEGHAQSAGMFSISGAEDKTPTEQGGLSEVTPINIIANEWPGDIYSRIWYEGGYFDADGSPVPRESGTEIARGVEVHARRVVWDPSNLIPQPELDPKERVWGS
jgi:hypothetical protein